MPTMLPRAILFDLDDTILDSTESATRTWRRTAEDFVDQIGHDIDAIDAALERARNWYWSDPERHRVGRLNLDQARHDVTHRGLLELGIEDADLARSFSEHYTTLRIDSMQPFPGAIETLAHFQNAGVRLAMLTNGKAQTQRQKVVQFDLARYFDVVLIEGELGYGKPDPRVYNTALAACGDCPPTEAWCVGDNLRWEVATPQAMGMHGVWVDWAGTGLPDDSDARPDRVVRAIRELW